MVRKIAAQILAEVHRSRSVFAADRIDVACRSERLDKRDRRFLTELVFGVLRHQLTLDCVLESFVQRPLSELHRSVHETLRLGVFQMLYLDGVPVFAAIDESVKAVAGPVRLRSFVNGVLRAVDREVRRLPIERDRGGASVQKRLQIGTRKVCFFPRKIFADPAEDEALYLTQLYSHSEFLVRRWLARFGRERTEDILRQQNETPRLCVRANRLRVTRDELLDRLARDQVRCHPGGDPMAVIVEAPPTELLRSKSFRAGLCTVQDETAMKVAPAVEAKAGERVLDLCAAPGGKSTHLAELTDDQATVLAVDRAGARLDLLADSIVRLGLQSVHRIEFDPLPAGDLPEPFRQPFDRVLVDAPCSNSGVMGRRPEARYRFGAERLESLAGVQAGLLRWAARRLAPGGRLVYSTCSLEEEENGRQVQSFLESHPSFQLQREELTLPAAGGADGGYFACLGLRSS